MSSTTTPSSLTPETTAADIPGWDSVAHVDLIVSIETRLKIKFKTSELGSLHNVGQLVGAIEYKLEGSQQPYLIQQLSRHASPDAVNPARRNICSLIHTHFFSDFFRSL